jgi:hypothetical protein
MEEAPGLQIKRFKMRKESASYLRQSVEQKKIQTIDILKKELKGGNENEDLYWFIGCFCFFIYRVVRADMFGLSQECDPGYC